MLQQIVDLGDILNVITLDPKLEQMLIERINKSAKFAEFLISSKSNRQSLRKIQNKIEKGPKSENKTWPKKSMCGNYSEQYLLYESFIHLYSNQWREVLSFSFLLLVGQRQKIDPSTLISNTQRHLVESTLNLDLNLKFETKYFQIHLRASYFCNQIEN